MGVEEAGEKIPFIVMKFWVLSVSLAVILISFSSFYVLNHNLDLILCQMR